MVLVRNQIDNSVEPPPMHSDKGFIRKDVYVEANMVEMDSTDVKEKMYTPKCNMPTKKIGIASAAFEAIGGPETCSAVLMAVAMILALNGNYGTLSLVLIASFLIRTLDV